ncbi:hypothetical protein [Micromonospora endolithica]|uniref:hypothetical protein n=1 Tax=Micromonospora endolithica TaxID=230091 RepID=UPI0011ABF9E5|nr:hypothetical protein [Micromonospora endolithica]TWJ21526.1 hypothetical protein JD76_01636 [Micromonospora endolithica]
MSIRLETIRAEALFVSDLQCSQPIRAGEVRCAVASTLRRYRVGGCAARLASEFGDHPEIAVRRMAWALAAVRAVYPTAPPATAPSRTGSPGRAGSAGAAPGRAGSPGSAPGRAGSPGSAPGRAGSPAGSLRLAG